MNWLGTIRNTWPLRRLGLGPVEEENEVPIVIVPVNQFTAFLQTYESYVIKLQTMLIWEKPIHSLIFLTLLNIFFGLTVVFDQCTGKLLTVGGPLFIITHYWQNYLWPEIRVPPPPSEQPSIYSDEWLEVNPSVYSVHEIGDFMQKYWEKLLTFKDYCLEQWINKRSMFCIYNVIGLVVLYVLKSVLYGYYISWYLLNIIVIAPGVYIFAIKPFKERILCFFNIVKENIWNKLSIGTEESSPDELKEFIPESGSEEAAAALSVPLLAADPPEVVASLAQREAKGLQRRTKKTSKKVSHPAPSANDYFSSPFSSLTSHLPCEEDLPSVSDSSEDEDEFLQGLLFDKTQQHKSTDVARLTEPSAASSDATDANNKVSLLATLLTQYPGVGQEILSNIGQNIMSHIISQAGEPTADSPQITEELSDEEDIYEQSEQAESLESRARRRMNTKSLSQDLRIHDDFEMITDDEISEVDE